MARINANGTITIFTTAPIDFDYGWTTEIEANAGVDKSRPSKRWRRVEIDAKRSDGQCMRYGSGLYPAVDSREFSKLIDYGLVLCGDAAIEALRSVSEVA